MKKICYTCKREWECIHKVSCYSNPDSCQCVVCFYKRMQSLSGIFHRYNTECFPLESDGLSETDKLVIYL